MGSVASARRLDAPPLIYQAFDNISLKSLQKGSKESAAALSDSDSSSSCCQQHSNSSPRNSISDSSSIQTNSSQNGVAGIAMESLKRQKRVRFSEVVTLGEGESDIIDTESVGDQRTVDYELDVSQEDRVSSISSTSSSFSSSSTSSLLDDDVLLIDDVLRVYLENGQTRSMRYNRRTTVVSEVIEKLKHKLKFGTGQFFGLAVVDDGTDHGQSSMTILKADDNIHEKILLKSQTKGTRFCLRVTFPPANLIELLAQDPGAFHYLYSQSCNDVLEERYSDDLKVEEALDLCGLHLLQWAFDERIQRTAILKNIESCWDLTPFVPKSLLRSMTDKQIRRRLSQIVRVHLDDYQNSFQVKREYLQKIEQFPSFGAQCFLTAKCGEQIFIGPKNGIELVRDSKVVTAVGFVEVMSVSVENLSRSQTASSVRTLARLTIRDENERERLELLLLNSDVDAFIALVSGYSSLHTNRKLAIHFSSCVENASDIFYTGERASSPSIYSNFMTSSNYSLRKSHVCDCRCRTVHGHLCHLACGYIPSLEGVVNQLETLLPLNAEIGLASYLLALPQTPPVDCVSDAIRRHLESPASETVSNVIDSGSEQCSGQKCDASVEDDYLLRAIVSAEENRQQQQQHQHQQQLPSSSVKRRSTDPEDISPDADDTNHDTHDYRSTLEHALGIGLLPSNIVSFPLAIFTQ